MKMRPWTQAAGDGRAVPAALGFVGLWCLVGLAGCRVDFSMPAHRDAEPDGKAGSHRDAGSWDGPREDRGEVEGDGGPPEWRDAGPGWDGSPWGDGGGAGGRIGDPCRANPDCVVPTGLEPLCLASFSGVIELPGGYCTARCSPGSPDPCRPDGDCYGEMGIAYCLKACHDSRDCRVEEGYDCVDPAGLGVMVCMTDRSP